MATNFLTWGLSGTLATQDPEAADVAGQRLWHWIDEIDRACNRFCPTSELSRLNRASGAPLRVSATFELALSAAVDSSSATSGLCDPTVLPALLALGYDRDFAELEGGITPLPVTPVVAPGVASIHYDPERHEVRLDPGCQLDFGASAKALVCDLVVEDLAPYGGVLVELGGDVALRGRGPDGDWVIGVSHDLTVRDDDPRVTLASGGVATSSTTTRSWLAGATRVNHVIDPRTGHCANGPYATATVAASSSVLANAFATASLLWGEDAPYYVAQAGWSGRFVRHDGGVEHAGGWPAPAEQPS